MKKSTRDLVFNKFKGRCYLCGTTLQSGWHIDHQEAIKRNSVYDKSKGCYVFDGTCRKPENDHIDNFMPSCPSCNRNKRDMSLEGFRRLISGFIVSLNRDSTQYKIAKRYGLIVEDLKPIQFYFETSQEELK